MNKRSIIKQVEKHVKQHYYGDLHHGWPHLNRVRNYAVYIAEKEKADIFVVELAALLHDIAKIKHGHTCKNHAARGASMARKILRSKGLDKKTIDEICSCINSHSRREPPKPKTLNQKVLYDADGLELVGAVGVMRSALYAAYYDKTWKDMHRKVGRRIHETNFYTRTAKTIAKKRLKLVKGFYKELEQELK